MLLSYKCIINTSLTKDKIFEVLQEVTIPYNVHSIFTKIKDFVFYEGKFEDKSFTCRPLPTQIPPYGNQNSLIPKVKGIIVKEDGKSSEVEIIISKTWIYIFSLLISNLFWVIYIFEGYSVLKCSLLFGGFSVAILSYFHFVACKTAELFERMLCGKKSRIYIKRRNS